MDMPHFHHTLVSSKASPKLRRPCFRPFRPQHYPTLSPSPPPTQRIIAVLPCGDRKGRKVTSANLLKRSSFVGPRRTQWGIVRQWHGWRASRACREVLSLLHIPPSPPPHNFHHHPVTKVLLSPMTTMIQHNHHRHLSSLRHHSAPLFIHRHQPSPPTLDSSSPHSYPII
jgi:hypothetical protein